MVCVCVCMVDHHSTTITFIINLCHIMYNYLQLRLRSKCCCCCCCCCSLSQPFIHLFIHSFTICFYSSSDFAHGSHTSSAIGIPSGQCTHTLCYPIDHYSSPLLLVEGCSRSLRSSPIALHSQTPSDRSRKHLIHAAVVRVHRRIQLSHQSVASRFHH